MTALLSLSRMIDALNVAIGKLVSWLVLAAVLVSAVNAVVRYSLSISSNAWLELQWYLFSAIFLLCAGYTLQRNEHIRIDIIASRFSKRAQAWIDVIGTLFFLLPMAVLILYLSLPIVYDSYHIHEMSGNAGGLLRWPVKILLPIGFALLILQSLSELIKRSAFLAGVAAEPGEAAQGHH